MASTTSRLGFRGNEIWAAACRRFQIEHRFSGHRCQNQTPFWNGAVDVQLDQRRCGTGLPELSTPAFWVGRSLTRSGSDGVGRPA